jgi:hypothetical protein
MPLLLDILATPAGLTVIWGALITAALCIGRLPECNLPQRKEPTVTPIMNLARRLPELLNRCDRFDDLASDHPEGSPRREALKRRSSAEFRRACALDAKIAGMPPRDWDDVIVVLALAVEFAESVDSALATDDLEHARTDIKHLRRAVNRIFSFAVPEIDFDLSMIGRAEMQP